MPIKDGYEVARDIRQFYRDKQAPQPMIVACTGHVEDEFIKKAWLYEIDEIIPKPVSKDMLMSIFNEILQE